MVKYYGNLKSRNKHYEYNLKKKKKKNIIKK